jgi:hypothetical protein
LKAQIRRTVAVTALLLVPVAVVGSEVAGQSTTATTSASHRPATAALLPTPLSRWSSVGGPSARAAASGCYGQTDRPHRSKHRPGYITVQGRTACPGEAVTVRVVLYRGAFGIWIRVGRGGPRSGVGFVKANASKRARCGLFKGVSYHTASNHLPTVTSHRHLIPCH